VSSELIEDVEDQRGVSVSLTIFWNGFAELTLHDVPSDSNSSIGPMISFNFTPDKKGFDTSKQIEDALRQWREHTSEIFPLKF
jgi:hypothetical protein